MTETRRKLEEARYFFVLTERLFSARSFEFEFQLNAFINSARNVTFVMQKEYSHQQGFKDWWDNHSIKTEASMAKFVSLRNISVKEKSVGHKLFTVTHDFGPQGLRVKGKKGPTELVTDPLSLDEEIPTETHVTISDDAGTRREKVKLVHDFTVEENYDSDTKQVKFDNFIGEAKEYLQKLEKLVTECESKFKPK